MGSTHSKVLSDISKEIWDYLLTKKITITTEYLPGALNKEAGFQSRTVKNSSKLKLDPKVFQKISRIWWFPDIDLLASRIPYQIPTYISWKLDSFSKVRAAFQMTWIYLIGYVFTLFALISRFLIKS